MAETSETIEEPPKDGDTRRTVVPMGQYDEYRLETYCGPTRTNPKGEWVMDDVIDFVDREPGKAQRFHQAKHQRRQVSSLREY